MSRALVFSLVVVVLGAVGWFVAVLVQGWEPELGLDLQGGIEVVLEPAEEVEDDRLDQAIEVIRNRVDALGVAEPDIARQGDLIIVQLPGVADADRARELIGQTAELQFRPVAGDGQVVGQLPYDDQGAALAQILVGAAASEDPSVDPASDPGEAAGPAVPPVDEDEAAATTAAPATTVAPAPAVTPADVITPREDDEPEVPVVLPDPDDQFLYVLEPSELGGTAVDDAQATLDPQSPGSWVVNMNLTSERSADFDALAAANLGRQVAVVLDGLVYSAPVIQQPTFDGSATISGAFTESEAKDLALVLRFGSLPVELEEATTRTVSATLGDDALDAGIVAGIVGLVLVGAFMIAYYRLLGVVAMLGLTISGLLLWSVIATLGETAGLALTLAGAVGIIVSIGVQVDSNVVYYERLKEDLRLGRSLRVSADSGFRGAFSTIVKADVASLIGALVLYRLTVGAVRGFALFLGVATILDLVVSLLFMRPAVVWLARRRNLDPRRVIGMAPRTPTTPTRTPVGASR